MNAEQMFKELGYEKYEDENSVDYERYTELSERIISFVKDNQTIIVSGYRWFVLKKELQKAIFKQCQDLGWLDD